VSKSKKKAASIETAFRGADNEIRTRDLNLGKVALYQLSYVRISLSKADAKINTYVLYCQILGQLFFKKNLIL
jgi:hypothetical protein